MKRLQNGKSMQRAVVVLSLTSMIFSTPGLGGSQAYNQQAGQSTQKTSSSEKKSARKPAVVKQSQQQVQQKQTSCGKGISQQQCQTIKQEAAHIQKEVQSLDAELKEFAIQMSRSKHLAFQRAYRWLGKGVQCSKEAIKTVVATGFHAVVDSTPILAGLDAMAMRRNGDKLQRGLSSALEAELDNHPEDQVILNTPQVSRAQIEGGLISIHKNFTSGAKSLVGINSARGQGSSDSVRVAYAPMFAHAKAIWNPETSSCYRARMKKKIVEEIVARINRSKKAAEVRERNAVAGDAGQIAAQARKSPSRKIAGRKSKDLESQEQIVQVSKGSSQKSSGSKSTSAQGQDADTEQQEQTSQQSPVPAKKQEQAQGQTSAQSKKPSAPVPAKFNPQTKNSTGELSFSPSSAPSSKIMLVESGLVEAPGFFDTDSSGNLRPFKLTLGGTPVYDENGILVEYRYWQ